MSKGMKVGSLFSGIGGFDLGFERAGFEIVWQVEIDEYCRRVLERHFPEAERFGDIRECGKRNLKPVDVITGGFPCQDLSKAGNRAGLDGERSGLWEEMRRVICELRPGIVCVENVPGMLIPDELWPAPIGRVLGDLAALGYDAEWDCLPAAAFGAPQPRDRAFILAYADRCGSVHGKTERFAAKAGMQTFGDIGTSCDARELRGKTTSGWEISNFQWIPESGMVRVVNGIPTELDKSRIRGLGNAVVPQIAQWIAERIRAAALSVRTEG